MVKYVQKEDHTIRKKAGTWVATCQGDSFDGQLALLYYKLLIHSLVITD